jgi:hypothetical protein
MWVCFQCGLMFVPEGETVCGSVALSAVSKAEPDLYSRGEPVGARVETDSRLG